MGQTLMNPMAEYFERMGREGRAITLIKDGDKIAIMTFSLCDNYEPYARKDLWEVMPHDPNGNICFIEKLICLDLSRDVFRELEKFLVTKYPQIEYAIWFRPGKKAERKVIYKRRFYEASLRN